MKPIRLTPEYVEDLKKELLEDLEKELNLDALRKDADEGLKKLKMTDGSFSFKKDFKFERKFSMKSERHATLTILPDAFAKMTVILLTNDKEVAWHAVTERVSDQEFIVKDILVYPQEVTSVTVDTDDEEYAKWLIDIGEENFCNLHGQMHSHVNMGVSPSGTDMGHREKIVSQLMDEDYYIFMIWNKSLKWSAAIYDMPSNALYDTEDIDVVVRFADGTTAGDVIQDLKDKVAVSKPVTYTPGYYGGTSYTTGGEKKTERQKSWWEEEQERKAKESQKKGVSVIGNDHDDFRYPYSQPSRYPYYEGFGGYYD